MYNEINDMGDEWSCTECGHNLDNTEYREIPDTGRISAKCGNCNHINEIIKYW